MQAWEDRTLSLSQKVGEKMNVHQIREVKKSFFRPAPGWRAMIKKDVQWAISAVTLFLVHPVTTHTAKSCHLVLQ